MLKAEVFLNFIKRLAPPMIAMVCFIAVWQLTLTMFDIPSFILPSPSEVLNALFYNYPNLLHELMYTFSNLLLGFVIAFLVSFVFAFLFQLSHFLERAMYPFLIALKIAPVIAIAPFLVLWFGLGTISHVAIVALICFFPLIVTMLQGLKEHNRYYEEYFSMQKATRVQTFFKLRLPLSLPFIFAGAKTSAVLAMSGVFVAEFITGTRGIGNEIASATRFFRSDEALAALFVAILGGIVFYALVAYIEKRVLFWISIDSR